MSDLFVGAPIRRKEDPDILLGRARYVSDVTAPGMLVACVVRSPYAHARINSIDTSEALAIAGVEAVYTADDLGPALINLASFGQFPPTLLNMWKPAVRAAPVTTMASDKVRFVGEPVALVVAGDRYVAEDAAERVHVDYEPLEPVVDVEKAMGADAPDIHDEAASRALIKTEPWRGWCTSPEQWTEAGELDVEWERNVGLDMHVNMGDVDGAFAKAAHTFSDRFYSHRYTGVPLEGRGMLAIPDTTDGSLKVWSSCQLPYFHRALISEALNISEDKVRVAQPYLGGGFGMKAGLYSEDILIPFAAMKLGRPVKWLEDKREQFQSSNHSREQPLRRRDRRRRRGQAVGLALQRDHRCRRLPHLSGGAALSRHVPRVRSLQAAGPRRALHVGVHQQGHVGALPRRRAARGGVHGQPADRPHRPRARHRRRRGAPAQLHRPRRDALRCRHPLPGRFPDDPRQRRLSGRPGAQPGSHRLRRFPRRPGARPGGGALHRDRHVLQHRGRRPRPGRTGAHRDHPHRRRGAAPRRRRYGAGPAHGFRANLRRRDRRRRRSGHRQDGGFGWHRV